MIDFDNGDSFFQPPSERLHGRNSLGAKMEHDDDSRSSEKGHQAIGEIFDLVLRQTWKRWAGQIRGEVCEHFRVHLKTGKPCLIRY